MDSRQYGTIALFVGLAAAWGSSFVAINAGLEYFPPILYAALRFELAALVMLVYTIVRANRLRPNGLAEWLHILTSGIFIYGGYHALLFVGQQYVTSAVAAILVSTAPILTIGFAHVLLADERVAVAGILGIVVSFVGVALVARPDISGVLSGGSQGELLIVAAAVSTAIGSVFVQRYPVDLSLESRQAWAMVLGAIELQAISLGRSESIASIQWSPEAIGVLAYLVVVPTVIGFLAYFALLDRLGSIETNLIEYVTPVFAALIGWLWLGEEIDTMSLLGFLVILFGFALLKYETLRGEFLQCCRFLSS
ncbi:DMT family transporter [Halalkalicoccus subterraneus]|uniref:DMT family transporter n=1 Tax=Halalkalicoccus subterraneus TaxID=2675002 RepID=UPI000EFA9EB1|nr:EamA family transporter [Halalkalicoccus subterraneus]